MMLKTRHYSMNVIKIPILNFSYVFEAFKKGILTIIMAGSSDMIECSTLNHIWLVWADNPS